MKQVALRLDDELAAAIDRARGDIPRERWIRGALEAALEGRTDEAKAYEVARAERDVLAAQRPLAPLGSPSSSLANFMPKPR